MNEPAGPGDTITVPAGWFLMGSEGGRRSNQPQRGVYLDAYALQRTEVSRREYDKFVEATGYSAVGWEGPPDQAGANLPAVGLLWEDAAAYCHWAGMRLPTEAEWEKAARGEDGRIYPWGNEWDPDLANTADRGPGFLLPVDSYPAGVGPYGHLNMTGNAAEWVADYFSFSYYLEAPDRNPTGPDQVMDRVIRGGSYLSRHEYATTFFRDSSHSVRPNGRVGFRCAISIQATDVP